MSVGGKPRNGRTRIPRGITGASPGRVAGDHVRGSIATPSPGGLGTSFSSRSAELLTPPVGRSSSYNTLHALTPQRPNMKKSSLGEQKVTHRKKTSQRSPLLQRRPLAPDSSTASLASSGSSRLRTVATADGNLSGSATDGQQSQDDLELGEISSTALVQGASATNGGSSSDAALDDLDFTDGTASADPTRTKAAIDHLNDKIHRTMDHIKAEQNAKEENVNEYLRLSANADKQQQQRIKTVFEKRNQKSTASIAQLQRKLEGYQKRLRDVETYGVSGHKQAKEVLRDVGQGLKDVGANIRDGLTGFSGGVVDNIRGAKDTIVSKPKEFAHLIKNKFGSADNINNIKFEDSQGSTEEGGSGGGSGGSSLPPGCLPPTQTGGGTLPSNFKYGSDDEASSVRSSGSGPSGVHSSPRPPSAPSSRPPTEHAHPQGGTGPGVGGGVNLEPLLHELREGQESRMLLREALENLKSQWQTECAYLKQLLEEERFRSERLEEQINDLTELHQHEVTNIKQELSSMEEKMEYQLEERTRDMQELLESCQTRITKMEMQAQQQQLISMEGIENTNFRALLTKMINVVLALLAVVLVFVSTMAGLLGPFLTTRVRILTTIVLVALLVAVWQNWGTVLDVSQPLLDKYRHLLPGGQ